MTTTAEQTEMIVQDIPVCMIDACPLNRQCSDDDPAIAELARTIAEIGLIAPITVRPGNFDRYEIICGERRWRAFRRLERYNIPCIVKNIDDTTAQIERITENLQRQDLSFMEQGEGVAALLQITGDDYSEVAKRLGYSESWVRRRAKLPNLSPAWRDELGKANTKYVKIRDSIERMEEVARLPAETQDRLLADNALRYLSTTAEMRAIISRWFRDLSQKPWNREWERKAYSGSSKTRCDACLKRSDRENVLFADLDDNGETRKMCLDAECWNGKCLAWCRNLLKENREAVPIFEDYHCSEEVGTIIDVLKRKPVDSWKWRPRNGDKEMDGYTATVGVHVDGGFIGSLEDIWLRNETERDVSDAHAEYGNREAEGDHATSDAEFEAERLENTMTRIETAIKEYLSGVDVIPSVPNDVLTDYKLRACIWFGVGGYRWDCEENVSLANPAWNPIEIAWAAAIPEMTALLATSAMEQITGEPYDATFDDNERVVCDALCEWFAVPLEDIIIKYGGSDYPVEPEEAPTPVEPEPEPMQIEDCLTEEDAICLNEAN